MKVRIGQIRRRGLRSRCGLIGSMILPAAAAAAVCTALLCGGCGGNDERMLVLTDKEIVWPEPPEEPRIKFVGAVSTQAQLEKDASWSRGLGEFFFGKGPIGVLMGPYDVAVDRDQRLFVSDTTGGSVHIFDLQRRRYRQFSQLYDDTNLLKPVSISLIEGKVYVVDSLLHKVCVFDKEGDFAFAFGAERFKRPSGIAYDSASERIFVADTARHLVAVFSRNGDLLGEFGSRGVEPGRFNYPTHLWVDHKGQLYVSDTLNYRIQVFDSQGNFIRSFGRQGDRPGNFAHPCGVATDAAGHIYVVDRQFENVQIFDSRGRILMAFGQEGSGPGRFWLPAGLFIDDQNRIYVADCFNKRVQIFEFLEAGSDAENDD